MNPNQPISVVLPASEWNAVLSDISQGIALRQMLLTMILAQAKVAEGRSDHPGNMRDEAEAFAREYELHHSVGNQGEGL